MRNLPALVLCVLTAACSFDPSGLFDGEGEGGGDPGPGPGSDPGDPGGGDGPPGVDIDCFYPEGSDEPAATIEHVVETVDGVLAVYVRLTLDPRFVDNTYGANAIGWEDSKKKTHTFADLHRSDHAQLIALDGGGATAVDVKLDYLSEDASAPSGFRALGAAGGDGKLLAGDAGAVLAANSSLSRNLNERGHAGFVVDSPATDAAYTPNPAAPDWDYLVVYEAWLGLDAFGPAGFGAATIEYIHASPGKGQDTIIVEPGECPPDWGCFDPDGCDRGDGDAGDPGAPGGDECNDDGDCPAGELCDDGVCAPYVE